MNIFKTVLNFILELFGIHTKKLTERQLDAKESELEKESKNIEGQIEDLEKKLEDKTLEGEVDYWKNK